MFELHDTQNDPFELTDLSGDPRQEPVLERLRRVLRSWSIKTGDRHVSPDKIWTKSTP